MKFNFQAVENPPFVNTKDWYSPTWQMQNALRTQRDFEKYFELTDLEKEFFRSGPANFKVQVTPYYASLARQTSNLVHRNPICSIFMPSMLENSAGLQQMEDPLGEHQFSPVPHLIHRYTDRALLLITDVCATYCRYCTRKYHTAKGKPLLKKEYFEKALAYIREHEEIREVILSGGDPLILEDEWLANVLKEIRQIDHIEIIRIGTRVPVVNPMRITSELARTLKVFKPVVLMMHFNHPKEISLDVKNAIDILADHGLMLMNQMVLLNGVNNHPAIVQALSRRLLYLGVKPYAMYQCDPSLGTDHLRTSVDNSLEIVNALWGRFSTLATPQFYLDIPGGGGKVPYHQVGKPQTNFEEGMQGWDGIKGRYLSPSPDKNQLPADLEDYMPEWNMLNKSSNSGLRT